ncbi:A/G-specific adenine glycosylase [Bacillus sp. CGMCC 1.16607]|uniref:A/G-specific adenine glycosylase n=1 Tax=Bacillus sp. CGMCC 1.16607 TaxID=3351842 RepID=UPI00362F6677
MSNQLMENLQKVFINDFQADLIGWYSKEKRDLPWRKERDPYRIWVSEIMLQQTRVDTVIPYYENFMNQFPSLNDFANADEEKILKAWEGLGYYSRVRNLQSACKEVQEKYDGVVPNTPKEIAGLKGIGPYTAGAVLSIAYGVPEPAVDGNVMRVLSRILSIYEDIAKSSTRKIFEEAVRKLISHENPSYFNQALMELGALICTPTSPSCLLCPVREHCSAFENGTQRELPVKTKKTKQKDVMLVAGIMTDPMGRILIHKRPESGLLASLWEFPNFEVQSERTKNVFLEQLKQEYNITGEINEKLGQIEHVFSHLKWHIQVYSGKIVSNVIENPYLKLVSLDELDSFAFPVSHQKMLQQFLEFRNEGLSL